MKEMRILVSLWLLLSMASFCRADAVDDLAKENAKLRQRVQRMEKELAELKKMVMQQGKILEVRPKPAVVPKLSDSDLQKILAMTQQEAVKKKPVWSNLDIQLYGYLKLDAAYDTSRMTTGNYPKWVDSEASHRRDNQFNMTARQTRLGMKITGPDDGDLKTSGRVEIDFYEPGAAENKPRIMMRHAYLKLDWPEDRFNIIAGQTSDVISPLFPSTLNYAVGWWGGNIGYRRPQIRLTKSFALNSDVDLKLEGALARTIGLGGSYTPGDAGEDAGYPGVQSRASLTFPLLGYKPTTLGVSGHWAKEEYDTASDEKHFDSWSLNLDLLQPINEWLAIKGELFTGENLSAYLGGIGQGVNTTLNKEIGSKGGWIAASLGPWDKWRFTIGTGVDDADRDDINAGDRELNRFVFGNVIYSITKNTEFGFELSQWHTERSNERDAENVRAQASFIYKF